MSITNAEIFGEDGTGLGGSNSGIGGENFLIGGNGTTLNNGTVNNISALIHTTNGIFKSKCALYKASDSSLIAYTEEKTFNHNGVISWETYNVIWGGTIVAGTKYYIVVWANSSPVANFNLRGWNSAGDERYKDNEVYNGFPNPAGFATLTNVLPGIYCNYTLSTGSISGNIYINRNPFMTSILIMSSMCLISMFMFYKKKDKKRRI